MEPVGRFITDFSGPRCFLHLRPKTFPGVQINCSLNLQWSKISQIHVSPTKKRGKNPTPRNEMQKGMWTLSRMESNAQMDLQVLVPPAGNSACSCCTFPGFVLQVCEGGQVLYFEKSKQNPCWTIPWVPVCICTHKSEHLHMQHCALGRNKKAMCAHPLKLVCPHSF